MVTKTRPSKPHPFDDIQSWSVRKHGVSIEINPTAFPFFDKECSLDVEHDGKGNFVGLGIYSVEANTCFYWNKLEQAPAVILSPFVAHNGISDIKYLKQWGFAIDESFLIWDTMLIQHILDSSERDYGLKAICKRKGIGEWPDYESIVGKHKNKCPRINCDCQKTLLDFPVEAVAEYNAADCYYTYQLYLKQSKYMITKPPFIADGAEMNYFNNIEKPCVSIFQSMEDRGIRIDLKYLEELKIYLEEQKQPIEQDIKNELGNINLASPKQVLEALHEKEIYPEFKGKPSTDKRGSISRMEGVRVVDSLMQFSELDTLLCSFVYPYLERGQETVHPRFNQVGTRTGRPSCSNPNLLQIPKRSEYGKLVRRMFVAREGMVFGDCDYGQIEPRLLAHLSKDETLCQMFKENIDFHSFTSERMQINRDRAKILNLSVGYRATFKSVSQQLKCSDTEAQKEIDRWWGMFPGLREWQDKLIYTSKKDGYCTTLMGRRIKLEGLGDYNRWKREHAQRQLINNICQASAAEVAKMALIKLKHIEYFTPLLYVYDEVLGEFPDSSNNKGNLQPIKECMENAVQLEVPLVVDAKTGLNWQEVK